MKYINFNYNWNAKLDCDAFTTMRVKSFHEIGDILMVQFKKEDHYEVKVIGKKTIILHQINEFIARLDTGYSAEECKNVLKTMYKNQNIDWATQEIYLYLLHRVEPNHSKKKKSDNQLEMDIS